MNNNTIISFIEKNNELRMNNGLDNESIKLFRDKIKVVDESESNKLGKEMFDLIAKKGFADNYEKVIEYIVKGANIEYKNDTKGDFALLICARKGYFKTFIALLKAGADVNQINNFHTTALMAAARHGYKNMLELLVMLGADVNAKCLDGDNALISAKRHDQIDCFNYLINHNAHLYHRNLQDESVFEIKSSKPFNLERYVSSIPVTTKVGSTHEEAMSLIEEANNTLKKILEQK